MITRRQFLKSTMIAGVGLALPLGAGSVLAAPARAVASANVPLDAATLTKYKDELRVPEVLDARGGDRITLVEAPGVHRFHSQLPPTPTWGYGGLPYLGPTLWARRGVPLTVKVSNKLRDHVVAFAVDTGLDGAVPSDARRPRTSVHLHGGNTESRSDGHPEMTFTPGLSYTYNYANNQEAATLWYHDHAMGLTRLNVYAGLAGFYLLRDDLDTGEADNWAKLPHEEYEIPLVLQDKLFDLNPARTKALLAFPPGPLRTWAPEFFGDVSVVNGTAWPNLEVKRGVYRFRILNGSNARFYHLALSNGEPFYQIGADGGLLDAPVALKTLLVAPGERADVLIDFSRTAPGTKIVVSNNAATPFSGLGDNALGDLPLPEIMQFTVTRELGPFQRIPAALRPPDRKIPRLPDAPAVVRNLVLVEVMDAASGEPLVGLLNNMTWHDAMMPGHEQMETPKVDTLEQWNIINTTGDTHPIHLHLIQFQVKNRQKFDPDAYMMDHYPLLMSADPKQGAGIGPWPVPSADSHVLPDPDGAPRGPEGNETGWKDTVQADPGEITRLLVPFGARIPMPGGQPGQFVPVPFGESFTGDYVWHCHILDHEDNEMMQPYAVMP